MNLRAYLRLLHPIHAVLWTAFYTWGAMCIGVISTGRGFPSQVLIGLTTTMPLLFGLCVANAAHAAMHRPFFPLLPDGARRLRRATLVALAIVAPLMAVGTAWFQPVPFLAALGLAAVLLTLPLTNPRGDLLGPRPGWVTLILGSYVLFNLTCGEYLAHAMNTTPWAFLLGGVAGAWGCFRIGFSPHHLRSRAATPYNSIGTSFMAMRNFGALRRFNREIIQYRTRLAPTASVQGRDWLVDHVGSDTWSWMSVFRHAAFARSRRSSYLRTQLLVALVLASYATLLPLLGFVFARLDKNAGFTLTEYWNLIASLSAPDLAPLHTSGMAGGLIGISLLLQVAFCAALSLMVIRPQLPYPISRQRLAQVVFGQSLVQIALALVLPALTIFLLCLVGQFVSGNILPGLGLPSLVAFDLGVLPLLPLLTCAGAARTSTRRILLALPVACALVALSVTRTMWSGQILTLRGLALVALATTATLLLLRWRLRQHYRGCDLTSEIGIGALTGLPATSPR